ncbi:TniB family NTP-binding protein [Sphingobium baderi]|uniref:TniB family NTP-binding protein n=1 Tax=Sphingobium baderi TaxID=1332080 RepID=UPI002B402B6E|nr:TniB family NTP-binding protein [Sphingobium baderi]WRD75686.1 TniB family NTP-binding protein [Sphingobium baderi]WRD76509.1 TniB family NTP-binding protein [Sphingobium baderi]WRD77092.1 TniB family NTP-binding protein [Sphingobium baderi]
MSASYAHLHAAVRPLADEDAASRIWHIRMDRWIGYARADAALEALEELLDFPQRTRMPNLLVVGPTNNGKTMIVEKFRRAYPRIDAADNKSRVASVPVLAVQMPSAPDESRFCAAILDELGMPYDNRARLVALQDAALRTMRLTGVRMLVIDELHNLLSGSRSRQRQLLNLLRWLGNDLRIPLVGVGTGEALQAINSDDQLVSRFEPFMLPLWTEGDAYRRLLGTLEAVLPLRRPSNLTDPALSAKILTAAEGVLGEVVAIVNRAAVLAVKTGTEAISARLIDDIRFIPLSERRRASRHAL